MGAPRIGYACRSKGEIIGIPGPASGAPPTPTRAIPIMPDITGLGSFAGTPMHLLTLSELSFTVREVFSASDLTP
jgi:hypothetical protein